MTIAEHPDEHIAVDINAAAPQTARVIYPSVDFRHGGGGRAALRDEAFGLVVTWTVLQHILPDRIDGAGAEIRRVLAPGATVLLCEETRDPDGSGGHTWHRRVDDYQRLLAPLQLVSHGSIEQIDSVPGMESPGELMLFCA